MEANDVNTYLLQAAKACIDNETHEGVMVAGYFVAADYKKNGVMITGTPWDITMVLANIIDKTAIQTNIPWQDIMRALRKILRNVQRKRKELGPGELFESVLIQPDDLQEDTEEEL
mgnify:CR=1 FL=1